MSEKLPVSERISILTKRIHNLNKGAGDYGLDDRVNAINAARRALAAAELERVDGQ